MKVSLTVVNTTCNVDKSLILAVRRTHVIHEPYTWQSSPQVLRSSVIRASHRCTVIDSISVGNAGHAGGGGGSKTDLYHRFRAELMDWNEMDDQGL